MPMERTCQTYEQNGIDNPSLSGKPFRSGLVVPLAEQGKLFADVLCFPYRAAMRTPIALPFAHSSNRHR